VDYAASTIVSFARARQRPSCVDKLLDKGQVGTRFYWIFIWGELCTLSLPVPSGSERAAKVAPVWNFVELYELILCFIALSFVLDFCFILLSKYGVSSENGVVAGNLTCSFCFDLWLYG
jgi:hypothetical protein